MNSVWLQPPKSAAVIHQVLQVAVQQHVDWHNFLPAPLWAFIALYIWILLYISCLHHGKKDSWDRFESDTIYMTKTKKTPHKLSCHYLNVHHWEKQCSVSAVASVQSNGHKAVHRRCVRVSVRQKMFDLVHVRTVLVIQQPDCSCAASLCSPSPQRPQVTLPRAARWLEPPQIPCTQFLWVTSLFCSLTADSQSAALCF